MNIEINEENIEQKLATKIARIPMAYPWMNAAGANCRTLEEITELTRSNSGAVVVGTYTMRPQAGNPGNTYYSDQICSVNYRGLPNLGVEYLRKHLSEMVTMCHEANKPIILSIAGVISELIELINLATEYKIDLVEINVSCPNTDDTSTIYNYHGILNILTDINERKKQIAQEQKLCIKLGPMLYYDILRTICLAINQCPNIVAVTSTNTYPDVLVYGKQGQPIRGAMGGPALKPISLAQIKKLENLLRPDIDIIGVGGISCAKDVMDYQKTSPRVKAVQLCTSLIDAGVKKFDDVLSEYVDELINAEKGG